MSFCDNCVNRNRVGEPVNNDNHREDARCLAQSTTRKKIALIVGGALLALAGLFLLLAALQILPHSINSISSLGFGGTVLATLLMAGGVVSIIIGVLKKHIERRSDIVSKYPPAYLKTIADHIIYSANAGRHAHYSKFVKSYVVKMDDVDDILCKLVHYPKTKEEIEDYESKIPLIVEEARSGLEGELKTTILISEFLETMKSNEKRLENLYGRIQI